MFVKSTNSVVGIALSTQPSIQIVVVWNVTTRVSRSIVRIAIRIITGLN